ncbi:MAG: hypothetical protein EBT36_06070 [Betaproteobacteria bacterium]|nr:hypothetical protein [Betaproteobacteria bacterium]HAB48744.1 hypothetical protein [Lautropia sp.]NBO94734.1 hypothetical protein [Betaproteobacteria bacterium]NBQ78248.1 hypothetical protein [Betaproteobacteria bacterium]NBQ94583.1 hypothetical protein [Betaproteobacteria bacterium]
MLRHDGNLTLASIENALVLKPWLVAVCLTSEEQAVFIGRSSHSDPMHAPHDGVFAKGRAI